MMRMHRVTLISAVTVALFLLFVWFSSTALGVRYNYTLRTVALGGAVLGTVTGVLGSFAVLRRQSLLGDALSHAALPGVAIAFLLAGRELRILLLGAGIAGWLGARFIGLITHTTRIKQDAAMGIVLVSWFAFGIALLAYIQGRADASQAGLDTFIFGQAAAIVERDVALITGVGLVAFVVLAAFWKEFKLITFDTGFAAANGFATRWLEGLLTTLIVVAIVLGLQLAGVILMVGLLIAPGVAARQWTHQLERMVVLAGVFGAFSGATGAIISAVDVNIPTGPMIIVVATAIVLVSMLFAPERGLLWTWQQQRRDRREFAAQSMLRTIYNFVTRRRDPHLRAPEADLLALGGHIARRGLHELARQGYAARDNGHWYLTEAGLTAARAERHNRQLWEAYRLHGDRLDLPLVRANSQQDIHDALPAAAVRKLEGITRDDNPERTEN